MSTFSLTAQGGATAGAGEKGTALWRGLSVGQLVFPALDDPYDGRNEEDFWLARYREYRALEWDQLDWASLRAAFEGAARALAERPEAAPELTFDVPGPDERLFLEMWFGFGDPPVAARAVADSGQDGRFEVTYGQHRICALADFPMDKDDQDLMGIGEHGFVEAPPCPPSFMVPVLVQE